jgi:hypothetical protein
MKLTITGTSGSLTTRTTLLLTVVAPPSFSISATPASISVTAGSSSGTLIAVTPENGFNGAVSLNLSELPAGVTASFSAGNAGTGTFVFHAAASAAPGTSTITLTGTSGNLQSITTINLTVTAASGFALIASPASLSLAPGASGASNIEVSDQGAFNGAVTFSIQGLPAGVTARFGSASSTHATTLAFSVGSGATSGTSAVTVVGTAGALTSQTTIQLAIVAPQSFTLSASPASLSIMLGASGSSAISINPENGFSGAVTFTAAGLPAGVTAAFSSAASDHATVTFSASGTASTGSTLVTIIGASGGLAARTTIALTIARPQAFTLSASPATVSIAQGSSGSSTLTLITENELSGTVTVGISGLPSGVTGSFSTGGNPASCVLTLNVTDAAVVGESKITVTGKYGTSNGTVTIALTVLPAVANTPVDLASDYNVMSSVTDGAKFLSDGGLDGAGRAYSSNLLGSAPAPGGAQFTFGPANTVSAVSGATIALPAGQFSILKLLATGVNGSQVSQTFTVTYTDGTRQSFTQSLSDWCTPQGFSGESKAIEMAYLDSSDGTRETRSVTLYAYTFNLNAGKTVKTLTLPFNRNVVVLGMGLGGSTGSSSSNPLTPSIQSGPGIVFHASRVNR